MSLELIDAHAVPEGIAITFATERGLESLTGTCEQVARLAEVMRQVGALAALGSGESTWIEDVAVGDAVVKLGISAGGEGRVRIDRAAAPSAP